MGLALASPAISKASRPRIVTVGGGVTETVFALGRGADVVATDSESIFPSAAASLPKVSYPKGLDPELVLSHRPDLVLMDDEVGPRAALDAITSSGARVERLPEVRGADDIPARVRMITELVGARARGEEIADALAADLAHVCEGVRCVATRRRALVLLGSPEANVLITAGEGSSAAVGLGIAGADNAAAARRGWGWIAPAEAHALAAEAIVSLFGSAPVSLDRVVAAPAVRDTPAGRERRVAMVDALAFVGFGPRSAHAFHAVASRIYPETRFPPLPARAWASVETAAL